MVGVYVDDDMIGLRNLKWNQGVINVIIGILIRVRLMSNVAESNIMTCQPGAVHTGISAEAFSQRRRRYGGTFQ